MYYHHSCLEILELFIYTLLEQNISAPTFMNKYNFILKHVSFHANMLSNIFSHISRSDIYL